MGLVHAVLWWHRWRQRRSLSVGGAKRTYYVHVPRGLDPGTPTPVVLALHGATMNGPMLAWFTGLNRKADEAGFIAVYPDGTGPGYSYYWNGGTGGPAARAGVDDVAFLRAVLDDLPRVAPVDPRRAL